jgi:hypothetical protein
MSHTVYSTKAIVLSKVDTAEADLTLWLLTEELGLIVARAQGARKESAKMRAHLQLYAYTRVSVVRGKYVWRITGAEAGAGIGAGNLASTHARTAFGRIATFIKRMTVADVGETLGLYGLLIQARATFITTEGDDVHDILQKELHAIAHILVHLGYLDTSLLTRAESGDVSQRELSAAVNEAIGASQL